MRCGLVCGDGSRANRSAIHKHAKFADNITRILFFFPMLDKREGLQHSRKLAPPYSWNFHTNGVKATVMTAIRMSNGTPIFT